MTDILSWRKKFLGYSRVVVEPEKHPELFNFLGGNKEERVKNLMDKIVPNDYAGRKPIFDYIVDFWERSTLSLPYMANSYRGMNLAHRPFMSPSGKIEGEEFGFAEQYRWDTFFQNRGLILAGGFDLARDQLLNLADVFDDFKRIPNALVSSYLSHAQPPMEIFSAFDLVQAGVLKGEWLEKIIHVVEEDLFREWLDGGSGKAHVRQTKEVLENYGLLTRYTSIHLHPLLASCEDGKDHNRISLTYGDKYLPVQLNSIIYGILDHLVMYYSDGQLGNNKQKASEYSELKEQFLQDFQKIFWCEKDKWRGFRNYFIIPGKEGHILYGDLAAEIFPLFCGIASPEQAEITKNNLEKYYKGDYGLATTSPELRPGGSIEEEPPGNWSYQWEYPNCWAPLMLVAVEGLRRYGYRQEALEYEKNWVQFIEKEFYKTHGFAEKSPYSSQVNLENGFYGMVKGFGWTIAVYLQFLSDLKGAEML